MHPPIRQFGEEVPGQDYLLRPGAYCVIRDGDRLAIVRTPMGAYLPGGGQQHEESLEETALREAREECGLRVQLSHYLGVADELIYAVSEQTYFRKRCSFFVAKILDADDLAVSESDHHLVWLPVDVALSELSHLSHRWAVEIS